MFVSIHLRQRLIVAALGCFLLNACASETASPGFLEQNWSESTRQKFYTTSQGSQIMPYKWFMALEQPDSRKGFFSDGLRRLGYIPNRRSDSNPDGLPVGFAVDAVGKDSTDWWIGMTCAACHTNQIKYNGTTMQIDGAPALADFYGLIVDIRDSVQATIKGRNDPKFIRFAEKVLQPPYTESQADELYEEVKDFSSYWDQYVQDSTPHTPWGKSPSRRIWNDLQPDQQHRLGSSREQRRTGRAGQLSIPVGNVRGKPGGMGRQHPQHKCV